MGSVPAGARAALAALLLLAACRDAPRSPAPAAGPGSAPASPAAPAPAPADPAERFLTASSPLRRSPSEPPKGKVDPKGPPLAFLHRGERVTSLEAQGDWSKVRASDGQLGWLRSASLLPSSDATEGTVLATAWAFDRPDLLAVNARRKVEPGTLVLVLKTRELFSEVDLGPAGPAWMLTDGITTRPDDVRASKLLEKARWLQRSGRPDEAREVLALLRASLPASALITVLAAELGEVPPTGDAAPTGPTGPADGAPAAPSPGGPNPP